jgi:hypothetical protein
MENMDVPKYIVTCLVLTDKAFSWGIFFSANCLHCLQKKIKLGEVCLLTVKVTISGEVFFCVLGILYMSVRDSSLAIDNFKLDIFIACSSAKI